MAWVHLISRIKAGCEGVSRLSGQPYKLGDEGFHKGQPRTSTQLAGRGAQPPKVDDVTKEPYADVLPGYLHDLPYEDFEFIEPSSLPKQAKLPSGTEVEQQTVWIPPPAALISVNVLPVSLSTKSSIASARPPSRSFLCLIPRATGGQCGGFHFGIWYQNENKKFLKHSNNKNQRKKQKQRPPMGTLSPPPLRRLIFLREMLQAIVLPKKSNIKKKNTNPGP